MNPDQNMTKSMITNSQSYESNQKPYQTAIEHDNQTTVIKDLVKFFVFNIMALTQTDSFTYTVTVKSDADFLTRKSVPVFLSPYTECQGILKTNPQKTPS